MTGALFLLTAFVLWSGVATAQSLGPKQVRVAIDFRQSAAEERTGLDGGGGLVITERRRGGFGSLGADSRSSRTTHTSGIFTIVQDGGDSSLRIATRVPYEDVRFYRDYASGAGYLSRGVAFESAGTSLHVHADVLPENRIRLRLVPTVSYFSPDGSGAIELTDASTELVVESGRPVMIGGGTTQSQQVLRRILGYGSRSRESETSVTLTATVR